MEQTCFMEQLEELAQSMSPAKFKAHLGVKHRSIPWRWLRGTDPSLDTLLKRGARDVLPVLLTVRGRKYHTIQVGKHTMYPRGDRLYKHLATVLAGQREDLGWNLEDLNKNGGPTSSVASRFESGEGIGIPSFELYAFAVGFEPYYFVHQDSISRGNRLYLE